MNTTLYRYFDSDGQLLYVGITGNQLKRQSQHNRDAHWFNAIATATFEHFEERDQALEAETNAIKSEKPLHNIAQNQSQSNSKIVLQLSAKMHLMQMLSEPDGGHDEIHAEWSKEVKSWLEPHECFDLDWEQHFNLHLMAVEDDYLENKRQKLPNHLSCELCKSLFWSSWYVQTKLPFTSEQYNEYEDWKNERRSSHSRSSSF